MSDRVYIPKRKTAHLTEQGTVTVCRIWHPEGFWGTGSQEEYERAAELPLCESCAKRSGILTEAQKAFLDNLTPEDRAWLIQHWDLNLPYAIIKNVQQMKFYRSQLLPVLDYMRDAV